MNQYPDREARSLAGTPEEALAGHVVRQIDAWTPPTPRWQDSAARARIAHRSPARQRGTAASTIYRRVKRRFDLIGWLLAQPTDRIILNTNPNDPRVLLHNRLIAVTYRYGGLYADLLHYTIARA
jgi:hypothetical protein